MNQSKLFGDAKSRDFFIKSLERMLMEGRAEEALSIAMQYRRQADIDDGFAFPDPWQTIENARLRGYAPDDQPLRGESFLPFIDANPDATAIAMDLSAPSHFGLVADENGAMDPVIETLCYTDDTYPFSKMSRAELENDCVSFDYAPPWQGEQTDASASLRVEGFGRLYGARCRLPKNGTAQEQDLYALESAIAAISFYLVVKRAVLRSGAPRP